MVGNACLLSLFVQHDPSPSLAPAEATRPPCAYKVAPSYLARSLFRRRGWSGHAVCEPRGREDGPAWRGNAKQSGAVPRMGREAATASMERCCVLPANDEVLATQHEVEHLPSVLIFLDSSPSGVRTRDLLRGVHRVHTDGGRHPSRRRVIRITEPMLAPSVNGGILSRGSASR